MCMHLRTAIAALIVLLAPTTRADTLDDVKPLAVVDGWSVFPWSWPFVSGCHLRSAPNKANLELLIYPDRGDGKGVVALLVALDPKIDLTGIDAVLDHGPRRAVEPSLSGRWATAYSGNELLYGEQLRIVMRGDASRAGDEREISFSLQGIEQAAQWFEQPECEGRPRYVQAGSSG